MDASAIPIFLLLFVVLSGQNDSVSAPLPEWAQWLVLAIVLAAIALVMAMVYGMFHLNWDPWTGKTYGDYTLAACSPWGSGNDALIAVRWARENGVCR